MSVGRWGRCRLEVIYRKIEDVLLVRGVVTAFPYQVVEIGKYATLFYPAISW